MKFIKVHIVQGFSTCQPPRGIDKIPHMDLDALLNDLCSQLEVDSEEFIDSATVWRSGSGRKIGAFVFQTFLALVEEGLEAEVIPFYQIQGMRIAKTKATLYMDNREATFDSKFDVESYLEEPFLETDLETGNEDVFAALEMCHIANQAKLRKFLGRKWDNYWAKKPVIGMDYSIVRMMFDLAPMTETGTQKKYGALYYKKNRDRVPSLVLAFQKEKLMQIERI